MSEYKALCAKSKESVLHDKQQWVDNIASEAEKALQCGQLKDVFCNFRRLCSARPRISSPVALADGALVIDKSQKLSCWKDHFFNLLNRPPAPLSEDLVSAAMQYCSSRPSYLMCTSIRGEGTEGIGPAKEWKSARLMHHPPRAAKVRGHGLREMAHFHLSVCLEHRRHS